MLTCLDIYRALITLHTIQHWTKAGPAPINLDGAHLGALHEVITACSGVRNSALVVATLIENDTVRTGAASIIRVEAAQDREFVVRGLPGEVKTLAVIVLVRIVVRTCYMGIGC